MKRITLIHEHMMCTHCVHAYMSRSRSIWCFRHEDLKAMLDSSKDGQKRDAMKLIIGVRVNWCVYE